MDLMGNQEFNNYINAVCSKIKSKEVQREVTLELAHHIQDISSEYLDAGVDEQEALTEAIARMGDAEAVGTELNRVHKPKPEWAVICLTFILAAAGLVIAFLLDLDTRLISPESTFTSKILVTILGFALATGLYFYDYRELQRFAKYLYLAPILGLFASAFLPDWLYSYRLASNIVEISPLFLVVSLAGMFQNWRWERRKYFVLALGMLVLPLFLVFIQPSLANALVLAAAFMVLMHLTGAKLWQIILPSGLIGVVGPLLMFLRAPYLRNRLTAYINPGSDPTGHGWLPLQIESLRNSAGLFGQGLNTDPLLLPNLQGELVLSYIIYTFGWLAGIVLIISVAALLLRLAGISYKVKSPYGKLIASGISTIIGVRFLWNILMNLGVLPFTGVSLPFISYGRVDFLVNMVMIGLILSIYRRRTLKGLATRTVLDS